MNALLEWKVKMENKKIKLKEGVIMAGLKLPMQKVLIEANYLWTVMGKDLVIASALDGEHSAGSYHYYGYALDFRTTHLTQDQALQLVKQLKEVLPSAYTVIWHKTHIHVQFNME